MADTRTGGLTADLPARTARRARPAAQERSGSSDTSLSLSAMRPSSGSEPAFIFCIALPRCTFTVASATPRRDPAIADSINTNRAPRTGSSIPAVRSRVN